MQLHATHPKHTLSNKSRVDFPKTLSQRYTYTWNWLGGRHPTIRRVYDLRGHFVVGPCWDDAARTQSLWHRRGGRNVAKYVATHCTPTHVCKSHPIKLAYASVGVASAIRTLYGDGRLTTLPCLISRICEWREGCNRIMCQIFPTHTVILKFWN